MKYKDFEYQIDDNEATIVEYIGDDRNVVIPSEINGYPVNRINDCAFKDCRSLISVVMPNSVTSIGDSAFEDCSSLTSITMSDNTINIGNNAFWRCRNLTSIKISNNTKYIGDSAFECCIGLSNIMIPDSVIKIGSYAFMNCTSLTSVDLPRKLTKIDYATFYGCDNLVSIKIPDNITFISDTAFNLNILKCIKCNPGTFAEEWARKYDIEVQPIMSELQQLLDRTSSPTSHINHSDSFPERSDHNEI